ncbi:MAG: hypothetical protein Q8R88_05430 [Desulfoprunum sp.]|nr:hypothetical protein [Desulfoprunum sp.]
MERCPLCNARVKGDSDCPRCRVDLAPLLALESQSNVLCRQAVKALGAGDLDRAKDLALQAASCQATPFALALAGFLASAEFYDRPDRPVGRPELSFW